MVYFRLEPLAGLGDGGEGDSRENGLFVEGECTVIIAASNTGKSIFTTQMAEAVTGRNIFRWKILCLSK